MNVRDLIRTQVAPLVARHKREQHDRARIDALHEALYDNENARSGPGAYEGALYEFSAPCGCSAKRIRDTDGESVWSEWRWNSAMCCDERVEAGER